MIDPLNIGPSLGSEREETTFAGLLVWAVCFHQGCFFPCTCFAFPLERSPLTGNSLLLVVLCAHLCPVFLNLLSWWHLTTPDNAHGTFSLWILYYFWELLSSSVGFTFGVSPPPSSHLHPPLPLVSFHHFTSLLLLFPPFSRSQRSPSMHVSLYLSSNFCCHTPTHRRRNLLLAPTFPNPSCSISCLFYASILSLICSLSPSPTLPLAAVAAY